MLDIQPNYAEQVSVESVYRDFALRLIQTQTHLDILSTPQSGKPTSLPSWAPDWCLPTSSVLISLTGRDNYTTTGATTAYCATRCSRALILQSENSDVLRFSGLCIDTIEECEQTDQGPEDTKGIADSFKTSVSMRTKYLDWKCVAKLHTWKPYITGECRKDAFLGSLVAGNTLALNISHAAKKNQYRVWSKSCSLYATLRICLPDAMLIAFLHLIVALTAFRRFFALCCFLPLYRRARQEEAFQALLTCVPRRIIIRTKKGYIGLAPGTTNQGDTVALLEGGRLPFILHRKGERWSIVGDCYIHGLMNGEAYDAKKCSTIWIA